jgi:hypothetical protein
MHAEAPRYIRMAEEAAVEPIGQLAYRKGLLRLIQSQKYPGKYPSDGKKSSEDGDTAAGHLDRGCGSSTVEFESSFGIRTLSRQNAAPISSSTKICWRTVHCRLRKTFRPATRAECRNRPVGMGAASSLVQARQAATVLRVPTVARPARRASSALKPIRVAPSGAGHPRRTPRGRDPRRCNRHDPAVDGPGR